MFNANEVNNVLNDGGIKTIGVVIADEPDLEDDEICITDMISIQVGERYLGVTVDNGDETFTMHPYTTRLSDIKKTLKRIM